MNDVIERLDRVMIRNRMTEGEFVVTQTRNTVGILTDEDQFLLNRPSDGVPFDWVKRRDLILFRKATEKEQNRIGW